MGIDGHFCFFLQECQRVASAFQGENTHAEKKDKFDKLVPVGGHNSSL